MSEIIGGRENKLHALDRHASVPERISVELTNFCSKGCPFCYNVSNQSGETQWRSYELIAFIADCARHGVRAVSFGGGEPLEYSGVFDVIEALAGVVFRSLTTNGLPLTGEIEDRLVAASPDKVHISIHFPHLAREVQRVREQVVRLTERGVRCGVNLLVEKSRVADCKTAVQTLAQAGVGLDRIVFLPLRGPTAAGAPTAPGDILEVAGGSRFQSMTCLKACAKSARFCAISWDKRVAWCSYTPERRRLETLDAQGLSRALDGLGLVYCGAQPRRETT